MKLRLFSFLSLALLSQKQEQCLVTASSFATTSPFGVVQPPRRTTATTTTTTASSSSLLHFRGGASRSRKRKSSKTASLQRTATGKKKVQAAKEKKSSTMEEAMKNYKQILPLTRIYITCVVLATLVGCLLGEELAQGVMALDPIRTISGLELWRPFTAASFLGGPSIGLLMSGYYLFTYGTSLERAYGSAQFLVFLASQMLILSLLSIMLGQPFFGQSVITSMLHVLSRSQPKTMVKWLVFNVPYWSLPYGFMLSDVLQAKSPMAALPHILGILSGHFYHFQKHIWPKMGGEDWLEAPTFVVNRLDPDAAKQKTKETVSSALKNRKRGKGRKLGK